MSCAYVYERGSKAGQKCIASVYTNAPKRSSAVGITLSLPKSSNLQSKREKTTKTSLLLRH